MQVGSLSFLYSFLDEQIKYSVRNNPSLTAPGTRTSFDAVAPTDGHAQAATSLIFDLVFGEH